MDPQQMPRRNNIPFLFIRKKSPQIIFIKKNNIPRGED
jgi:hypothetical protein